MRDQISHGRKRHELVGLNISMAWLHHEQIGSEMELRVEMSRSHKVQGTPSAVRSHKSRGFLVTGTSLGIPRLACAEVNRRLPSSSTGPALQNIFRGLDPSRAISSNV